MTVFKRLSFRGLIFCVCTTAGAVNVDLKGKVVDTIGVPVSNCVLWLKNHPAICDTSDNTGDFSLAGDFTGVLDRLFIAHMAQDKLPVDRIFSVDGRMVPVSKNLPLRVWIVRYRAAGGSLVTTRRLADAAMLTRSRSGPCTVAKGNLGKTAVTFDSIVAKATGLPSRTVGVVSLTDNFIIMLTSAPMWLPASSYDFQRKNGMMLIRAKDYYFSMGQENLDNCYEQASPVRRVRLTRDYWMDTTEITRGSFVKVLKKNKWVLATAADSLLPASEVTWYDAAFYCNARSKLEQKDTVYRYSSMTGSPLAGLVLNNLQILYDKAGYRLPTEAEWEYACRAGTTTECYWGNLDLAKTALISQYAVWVNEKATTPSKVASRKPNLYGLYDMIGNVWEYTNDQTGIYVKTDTLNPVKGPANGTSCVVRGASWDYPKLGCYRSTARGGHGRNQGFKHDGFRTMLIEQGAIY